MVNTPPTGKEEVKQKTQQLFEELYNIMQGVFLIGDLSQKKHQIKL